MRDSMTMKGAAARRGRWLRGAGLAVWLLACPWAVEAAAAPPWPASPYTYQADNQSLRAALEEFARHFGLRAQVSADVEGIVNGRVGAATPTEFLDRLSNMFGLMWFHYAGTVYVTRSTNRVTRSLALPATEPGTWSSARAWSGRRPCSRPNTCDRRDRPD